MGICGEEIAKNIRILQITSSGVERLGMIKVYITTGIATFVLYIPRAVCVLCGVVQQITFITYGPEGDRGLRDLTLTVAEVDGGSDGGRGTEMPIIIGYTSGGAVLGLLHSFCPATVKVASRSWSRALFLVGKWRICETVYKSP